MTRSAAAVTVLLAVYCIIYVTANISTPDQGFFMITNLPERERDSGDIYIYAINTPDLADAEIEFSKAGGLPSDIIETGVLEKGGTQYGCYLKIRAPKQHRGIRFGTYNAVYLPTGGNPADPAGRYAFVKPNSKLLDTRGVYTVTIYPEMLGQPALDRDSPRSVGVKWTPGCSRIAWNKGNVRNVQTGPRLNLKSTEDAGLYTIRRKSRSKVKGWFVQIRVIASGCTRDRYRAGIPCSARTASAVCMNGGVGRSDDDKCICQPFFIHEDCRDGIFGDFWKGNSLVIGYLAMCCGPVCAKGPPVVPCEIGREDISADGFVLARETSQATKLECKDLPGGNELCKGYLVCYGDNYGCACAPGWHGNNCDIPCPKGKWGSGCSQRCPGPDSECNPHFGTELDWN